MRPQSSALWRNPAVWRGIDGTYGPGVGIRMTGEVQVGAGDKRRLYGAPGLIELQRRLLLLEMSRKTAFPDWRGPRQSNGAFDRNRIAMRSGLPCI